MLILTLKKGEKVCIGDKISVIMVEVRGNKVNLGIEAPAEVAILREALIKGGKV